ncbi:MAG: hypothetical protein Q7R66_10020 [Undibacterium sp.]|uniref:hypothetical protein n=1 Tax=Undibacterium sp. TaxID=1914977 RepID=UPI002727E273|nr:hypothetical protein [Undibacterium sp.]MDO8652515.1 hypothetical protein [Undibacterium sp.]
MNSSQRILFILCSAVLGACQAVTPPASAAVAARLLSPSPQARQELSLATAKLLGIPGVTLAEQTLLDSSQFAYARKPRHDAAGQLLQGRVIEQPAIFKLELRGQQCWLVYPQKARETLLTQAKCVAE